MPSPLADAHIDGQARLRRLVQTALARAWRDLPGYDERNVRDWLTIAVPLVDAGQRQSIALTDAYIARALDRGPVGVDPDAILARVRGATTPDEVYRRPFVTVWTALSHGIEWQAAVGAGLARATGTAAMDIQMAMRGGMQAVQDADQRIRGYRRVPDAGACAFCRMVAGAFVKSATAMPLHNNCGCGLEPVTGEPPAVTPLPDGVAVHEHGELGPVLGDPSHDFTQL